MNAPKSWPTIVLKLYPYFLNCHYCAAFVLCGMAAFVVAKLYWVFNIIYRVIKSHLATGHKELVGRKSVHEKIVFDGEITFADGKTYSINAREKQGCFLEIVERIKQPLDAMLSYHRKVFVCIFLFHLHDYTQENALFSKFMRKLVKRLKQGYGFKRIGYAWVREHGSGQAQHYHLALFLNGSLIQYPQGVFELAADIWEGWNQPRPALNPKRSYYMVMRGGDAGYQVAFHHLSYLAKTRTKAARAKTTNDYSASRLRPSRAR